MTEDNLRYEFKKIRELYSLKFFSSKKAPELIGDFINKCQDFVNSTYIFNTINELFSYFENNVDLPKCSVCGKTIPFKRYYLRRKNQIVFYCSNECSQKYLNSSEYKKQWKNKVSKTCLKKYGVCEYMKHKDFREKSKKTINEKYGVDNVSQNGNIKEKKAETFLAHYGVTNIFAADEGKEKIKDFYLKNYGVDCAGRVKEIRDKIKKTCEEKFGSKCFISSQEYVDKILGIQYDKLVADLKQNGIIPLFDKKEYIGVCPQRKL